MHLIDVDQFKKVMFRAGELARTLRQEGFSIDRSIKSNISTSADKALSEYLDEELPRILNVPIINEETYFESTAPTDSQFWLVDPIDGTLSFINGFDGYVTQAALMINGVPTIAIVYAPESNELFFAESKFGAFKNEIPIRVSPNLFPQSIIDNYSHPDPVIAKIITELGISHYHESGSLGLKICRVAEGTADLFVKHTRVYDWDIAPGALILKEAGGHSSMMDGREFNFKINMKKENFLASNKLQDLTKLNSILTEERSTRKPLSPGATIEKVE